MSKADSTIKRFDFDEVFRFDDGPRDAGMIQAVVADLHGHLAELEAQLAAAMRERDEAVALALSQGHAAGLEQARKERAEAQLAATDALHAAFDDLGVEFAAITSQMTRDTAQLALSAAEILAGHALDLEPSRAFDEALGRALHQLAFGATLLIRAHPDSIAHFEHIVAARRERQGLAPTIHLIADDQIAPHDAHISWGQGGVIVDAAERRAAVLHELAPLLDIPAA